MTPLFPRSMLGPPCSRAHSLGRPFEVGQDVVTDDWDELLRRLIQEVTLQHVEGTMQGPDLAGQVATPQGALQQPGDGLSYRLVLHTGTEQRLAHDGKEAPTGG